MHGGDKEGVQNLSESLKGSNDLQNLGIDGRIILKWILTKQSVNLIHVAQNRNHCEHFCSIKGGKFLGQLRNCHLLKKDSAPWS
jgi:hypothetical protein